jgi:hypothetical protein
VLRVSKLRGQDAVRAAAFELRRLCRVLALGFVVRLWFVANQVPLKDCSKSIGQNVPGGSAELSGWLC